MLIELTEKERETLETFVYYVQKGERTKKRIYTLTARKLGLADSTVRSRVSRLRSKYERLLETMKEYRGFQQRLFQNTGGKFNPLGRRG